MAVEERRSAKRYRCCGRVEIPGSLSARALRGVVVDVSLSGYAICLSPEIRLELEPGEECFVELKFATSYLTFRAVGAVRSCECGVAADAVKLGVSFVGLNERGRADIGALIRDQEQESC